MIYHDFFAIIGSMKSFHGVLAISKPPHMTSFDVCNHIKKLTKAKVGHTGTLDPDATGVLIVCVGATTKYVPFLMGQSKIYESQLNLGFHTHSLDTSGKILDRADIVSHPFAQWQRMLDSMIGSHRLPVPQVSAIKVDGERLYAKENVRVEDLPIKTMTVYDAKLLAVHDTFITLQMHVSSGSYIRTLNCELAKRAHNLGTTSHIVRVKNGRISLSQCQSLPQTCDELHFLDPLDLFTAFTCITLDDVTPLYHGKIIPLALDEPLVCVIENGKPFAMLEKVTEGYRVKRGLWYEDDCN